MIRSRFHATEPLAGCGDRWYRDAADYIDAAQQEVVHGWPTPVAGGQQILFTCVTGPNTTRIESVARATGERRVIADGARFSLYAETGHLLFMRDGALFAAPFNLSRDVTIGPPVRVLDACRPIRRALL